MAQPPLDELQYRRPEIIQWWVDQGGQPMDENMLHRYLSESPFFDFTTKNGLLLMQSRNNLAAYNLTLTRQAFEASLRKQTGSEYMITGDAVGGNGVWNIRKQFRRQEGLETLGTYYVVGENVYQAPAVGDVVGSRLVAAATSLGKFFETARGLAEFEVAGGYKYLPHSQTAATKGSASATSPSASREGSVLPDAQSLRSTSMAPDSQASLSEAAKYQDARQLYRSLQQAEQYSEEFTDENPLIGEPGKFSWTSSTAAVKKRKADAEIAAKEKEEKRTATTSRAASPKPVVVPEPPAVMTAKVEKTEKEKDRRSSKMGEKVKRKKSRAVNSANVTPTTPRGGSVASALPPPA